MPYFSLNFYLVLLIVLCYKIMSMNSCSRAVVQMDSFSSLWLRNLPGLLKIYLFSWDNGRYCLSSLNEPIFPRSNNCAWMYNLTAICSKIYTEPKLKATLTNFLKVKYYSSANFNFDLRRIGIKAFISALVRGLIFLLQSSIRNF